MEDNDKGAWKGWRYILVVFAATPVLLLRDGDDDDDDVMADNNCVLDEGEGVVVEVAVAALAVEAFAVDAVVVSLLANNAVDTAPMLLLLLQLFSSIKFNSRKVKAGVFAGREWIALLANIRFASLSTMDWFIMILID